MVNKEDLAYLAGLVDGDGSIGLSFESKRKVFRPRFRFMMNSNDLLQNFLIELGFSVYKSENSNATTFRIRDKRVMILLNKILPYLKIRKKRAELVLEACLLLPGKNKKLTNDKINRLAEIKEELNKIACRKGKLKWNKKRIQECFLLDKT